MITAFEGPTADNVWLQAVEKFRDGFGVSEQGSRGGSTTEILHAAFSVSDPRQRWVISRQPALNPAFALAEIVWIMAGRRDLEFLKFWNPQLPKYVGNGPNLHGAYGYRLRHHFGFDQLERAFRALKNNPETRQVTLQIWDGMGDLPMGDGKPRDKDIPCNTSSMLKVREGKLEWLQVLRSNDMFLGIPHNFVQFTTLQEIMAGWLGLECGSYNHVSDSLHIYERDMARVMDSGSVGESRTNIDSLALPYEESISVFDQLEQHVALMIDDTVGVAVIESLASWESGHEGYNNINRVLVAEALRRRGAIHMTSDVMASCSNKVLQQLWQSWLERTSVQGG